MIHDTWYMIHEGWRAGKWWIVLGSRIVSPIRHWCQPAVHINRYNIAKFCSREFVLSIVLVSAMDELHKLDQVVLVYSNLGGFICSHFIIHHFVFMHSQLQCPWVAVFGMVDGALLCSMSHEFIFRQLETSKRARGVVRWEPYGLMNIPLLYF